MSIIQNSCLTCKYWKKAFLGYINSDRKESMHICSKCIAEKGQFVLNCMEYDPCTKGKGGTE